MISWLPGSPFKPLSGVPGPPVLTQAYGARRATLESLFIHATTTLQQDSVHFRGGWWRTTAVNGYSTHLHLLRPATQERPCTCRHNCCGPCRRRAGWRLFGHHATLGRCRFHIVFSSLGQRILVSYHPCHDDSSGIYQQKPNQALGSHHYL